MTFFKEQIAPCGINCGTCLAYLRDKNKCGGCNAAYDAKPKSCNQCIIKNCELLAKTSSGYCYDCEKYPCKRLKQLDKRYKTRYYPVIIDNLNAIKSEGMVAFLQKEEIKWRCPNCGGTICVHRSFCLVCKDNETM